MERVRSLVVEEELTHEKVALIIAIACHVEEGVVPPSPAVEEELTHEKVALIASIGAELMSHGR